ncbi:histone deacetylase family protein [Bordetella pertussis]|nr:histone deacetylase family protein [Bordetella pertussis]
MGDWHPESPQRLDAISDQLLASGLLPYLQERQAPEASRADILRVHTPAYLDSLRAHQPEHGYYAIDADTSMNRHTYEAALRAAGAGWRRSTRCWAARPLRHSARCVRPATMPSATTPWDSAS